MQSDTYNGMSAILAVDNTDATCTLSPPEETTWWSNNMEGSYVIHTIVLRTGLAFGCKCLPSHLCLSRYYYNSINTVLTFDIYILFFIKQDI